MDNKAKSIDELSNEGNRSRMRCVNDIPGPACLNAGRIKFVPQPAALKSLIPCKNLPRRAFLLFWTSVSAVLSGAISII